MTTGRWIVFLSIVLGTWAVMHLFVFWRLASVPWVATHLSRRALIVVAVLLWASYPLARLLDSRNLQWVAWPLEFLAANWIGVLFLLFSILLLTEIVTVGGWLWPRLSPSIRGWAVLFAGALAVLGLFQGLRPPVLRDYEVSLAGLPAERDGLVLVVISDMHLGNLIGRGWMARVVQRVNDLRPDLVAVAGDVVDGNVGRVEPLRPVLERLKAPLGVWAVTGNHEYYAGLERSVSLFEQCGFSVLRNRWAEAAPNLVLAGVDDLTARRQIGDEDRSMEKALADRPWGATIVLSHSPWQAEEAARAGAGLMLCGHTHSGQIWPFGYLVGLRYPLLAGRYEIGGMTVIVCRGTGTWGPRMRLWKPGEIVRIRLRAAIR